MLPPAALLPDKVLRVARIQQQAGTPTNSTVATSVPMEADRIVGDNIDKGGGRRRARDVVGDWAGVEEMKEEGGRSSIYVKD